MRCRMSSAMGSVGPPASMKRGVMGGASALAPPARLCPPAAAPAHGTHSSLWAASGDTPARGNNTRPRDAGRHRAWRVERTTKGCEARGEAARTREGERTARTRATGGAPTHRLDIAPARGRVRGRLPAWQWAQGNPSPWRLSPRLSRSSRPATSQPPRSMLRRCVPVAWWEQGTRERSCELPAAASASHTTSRRVRATRTAPELATPRTHAGRC